MTKGETQRPRLLIGGGALVVAYLFGYCVLRWQKFLVHSTLRLPQIAYDDGIFPPVQFCQYVSGDFQPDTGWLGGRRHQIAETAAVVYAPLCHLEAMCWNKLESR